MIEVANAPVSYGVFDLARPELVSLPDGESILAHVADAGYTGVDLGPHGLFGTGPELVKRLEQAGLGLAGGWLDFPFTGTNEAFISALQRAMPILEDFSRVAETTPHLAPLPTIADAGSEQRRAHPGGGPDLELPPKRWATFVARLEMVTKLVRDYGLEPTFHHHACTYVETPNEIERLLADTSINLTFDTGHLLIGGGDPLTDYERWSSRINHVHLKDVNRTLLTQLPRTDRLMRDVWEHRVFVALGEGDLDIAGFLAALLGSEYDGWLVVEQDVVLMDHSDIQRSIDDQNRNREVLRKWLP